MSTGAPNPQQAIDRLWPQVTTSPELHLHQLDVVQQAGLFVQMPPGAYRAASFLDGRSFTPQTVGAWVPLQRIRESVLRAAAPATPLHFIFHMGHVGSTLLSRLLDESRKVQSLREPLVLRNIATLRDQLHENGEADASLVSAEDVEELTEIALRLWSRCRDGRDAAVLKATSTAARIAGVLMAARPSARAVYLSMAPEPYLAVILGGPASLLDVRGHAEERMKRLIRMLGKPPMPLHAMSPGELVAASWATEALTREHLINECSDRLLTVDFDEFLSDVPAALGPILEHFGLDDGPELAARLARSPVLGRYAKAPEHGYSSRLRDEVIRESREQNSAEIGRGMAFLRNLGEAHRDVAALIDARA